MKEQANLTYIKQIAGNDASFQDKLINVIKTEFPIEKAQFLAFYKQHDYVQSAEMVHKLKHKINIFGLEKSYVVAKDFENQLKENNNLLYSQFLPILEHIETYLYSL